MAIENKLQYQLFHESCRKRAGPTKKIADGLGLSVRVSMVWGDQLCFSTSVCGMESPPVWLDTWSLSCDMSLATEPGACVISAVMAG